MLCSPAGDPLAMAIYSAELRNWYDSAARRKYYSEPRCFFCDRHDEYCQLHEVCRAGHLAIYDNRKFCEPAHYLIAPLEHREQLTALDIVTLYEFSQATGLTIFANLRDAGASYPQHLHFQSLDVEFASIPRGTVRRLESPQPWRVAVLDYPCLLLQFEAESAREWPALAALVAELPSAVNALWSGPVLSVIPRTKQVPGNTGGNKFAAAEVFGRIYCRDRELFERLDVDTALEALRDVALPAGSEAAGRFLANLQCRLAAGVR